MSLWQLTPQVRGMTVCHNCMALPKTWVLISYLNLMLPGWAHEPGA